METARSTISKAKIKDSQLEVAYEEIFVSENYSNEVSKKCSQVIHADMRRAFDELKRHLVLICEMPEADKINSVGLFDFPIEELQNYIITGYSHGGSDETAGVVLIGQKLLGSGKVLNITTPFIQFEDSEAYRYAGELYSDIEVCDHEVGEYLFNEKFGIKQLDLGFDTPDEASIIIEEMETDKPKKKRKAKKVEVEIPSMEAYA